MKMRQPVFAGIDIETTGLDAIKSKILEIAVDVRDINLDSIFKANYLIAYAQEQLKDIVENVAEAVFDMHSKSGLWKDLLALAEAGDTKGVHENIETEEDLCSDNKCTIIKGSIPADQLLTFPGFINRLLLLQAAEKPMMFGFNPFFDWRWLHLHAPGFLRGLHYRLFDMSTLKVLTKQLYGDWGPSWDAPHRGRGDLEKAYAYLRWYRLNVCNPHNRTIYKEL
jgi:oligoribonuclease (3'-5' exoribonuclease)